MGSDAASAIEVEKLAKHFGSSSALANLDLSVPSGQFLAVFGPNGAGKTTLIRILAALARPSSGTVRIHGRDIAKASPRLRRHIGLVSHRSFLYPVLSAHQNVAFFARMFGVEDADERARSALAEIGLEHRMHDPVASFSRGMEQRCAIARALVHDPDILLFDEPFSGLDPDASQRLHDRLKTLHGSGRTVLLTSHDLAHGAENADRVAILARGRLVFDAPRSEVPDGDIRAAYHAAVSRPAS